MLLVRIGTITAFPHCVGKWSCDRLRHKIYLSRGANFVEQPLIIVQGVPSSATDWEGLRGFIALKMLTVKWKATANSHWTTDYSDSHWRITINRLELFCRTWSYLHRFNCISTVYKEMNYTGIVFGNWWYIFTEFGRLGFYIISFLITVKFVRLVCNLNKLQAMRRLTVIILAFIFVVTSM